MELLSVAELFGSGQNTEPGSQRKKGQGEEDKDALVRFSARQGVFTE